MTRGHRPPTSRPKADPSRSADRSRAPDRPGACSGRLVSRLRPREGRASLSTRMGSQSLRRQRRSGCRRTRRRGRRVRGLVPQRPAGRFARRPSRDILHSATSKSDIANGSTEQRLHGVATPPPPVAPEAAYRDRVRVRPCGRTNLQEPSWSTLCRSAQRESRETKAAGHPGTTSQSARMDRRQVPS